MFSCRNFYDATTYRTEFYWENLRKRGVPVCRFFEKYQYSTIAIYGLNGLGKKLQAELENTNVLVKNFIDKRNRVKVAGIETINLEELEKLEDVDVIVVAPVLHFNTILNDLLNVGWDVNKILSIEDVIFSLVWEEL